MEWVRDRRGHARASVEATLQVDWLRPDSR